jgi:RNA polymerase sigma-70 factor (ECF subfamily)
LYEKYNLSIYRYCLKMFGESAAAEDAVQEPFLKMYSRIEQLTEPNRLLPWLFGIAHNEVLMYFRRHRRDGFESAEDVREEPTPHDLAVKSETQEIVRHLLGQLKNKYPEILILRECDRLSYGEIAAITGDTENFVKSRKPKYPESMLMGGWEGPAYVEVPIDVNGNVADAEVESVTASSLKENEAEKQEESQSPESKDLRESALAAARQWKFTAVQFEGKPISA